MSLEKYFSSFRENIIGRDQTFLSPFGEKKIIYADWIASGRIYKGIERKLNEGGISLQEESKVTTVINPKSNFIIEEGQRAIVIP